MDLSSQLRTLLLVAAIAAVAPAIAAFLPGPRVPQVVVFLIGGLVIGPHVAHVATPQQVELVANVGLGFVFLLAGFEVDLRLFARSEGRRALLAWAATMVFGAGVVAVLTATGVVRAYVPVALALTTTALGTLLPILQRNDMLGGAFGRAVLASGAVGELLPIIAIALFLGAKDKFVALASLVVVGGVGLLLAVFARLLRRRRILDRLVDGQQPTTQGTLRWTVVLMLLLLVLARQFQLDAVLGAFVAGLVLRRWAPGDVHALEGGMQAVGYGFFIPVFFVWSGMSIDVGAIARQPLRPLLFLVLLAVVRGLPVLLVHRRVLPWRQRLELSLLTVTTLPLLVALTEIGLRDGTMLPQNAAALVGAGVLSVLLFPGVAVALHRRGARPAGTDGPDGSGRSARPGRPVGRRPFAHRVVRPADGAAAPTPPR